MPIEFNADEVFAIAEKIEINGAKYYRKVADRFKDSVRKTLLDLAAMEDHHLAIFKAMRSELVEDETKPTVFDPDSESAAYLSAMADTRVFNVNEDPTAKLTGSESPANVLRTAIGFEKDSIVFYLGMKDLVPPRFGGTKIQDIIHEEMRHVQILNEELARVL